MRQDWIETQWVKADNIMCTLGPSRYKAGKQITCSNTFTRKSICCHPPYWLHLWRWTMGIQRLWIDGADSTFKTFKDSIVNPHKFWLSKKVMGQAYFKLEEKIDYSFQVLHWVWKSTNGSEVHPMEFWPRRTLTELEVEFCPRWEEWCRINLRPHM